MLNLKSLVKIIECDESQDNVKIKSPSLNLTANLISLLFLRHDDHQVKRLDYGELSLVLTTHHKLKLAD